MAKFNYRDHLVQANDVISAKLGTGSAVAFTEVGKPFKLDPSQDSTWIPCADGNEVEGFLYSLNEEVKYDGRVFGGVQVAGFKVVPCSGTLNVGDYVIANGSGGVKAGVIGTSVVNHKWRVYSKISATLCTVKRV